MSTPTSLFPSASCHQARFFTWVTFIPQTFCLFTPYPQKISVPHFIFGPSPITWQWPHPIKRNCSRHSPPPTQDECYRLRSNVITKKQGPSSLTSYRPPKLGVRMCPFICFPSSFNYFYSFIFLICRAQIISFSNISCCYVLRVRNAQPLAELNSSLVM